MASAAAATEEEDTHRRDNKKENIKKGRINLEKTHWSKTQVARKDSHKNTVFKFNTETQKTWTLSDVTDLFHYSLWPFINWDSALPLHHMSV